MLPFERSVAPVRPTMSPCTCATSALLLQKQSLATEKNADYFSTHCVCQELILACAPFTVTQTACCNSSL